MSSIPERRARLRDLVSGCTSPEAKLRLLRDCGRRIGGSWHYPDDCEPCWHCITVGTVQHHPRLPALGVRGYLGTGPFAIVSDKPSGDVHFQSKQAGPYYSMLKKYGLERAFLADVLNTSDAECDRGEQKALFLTQVEIVRPQVMLVMDMCSRRKKRSDEWRYPKSPLPILQQHLDADGFSLEVGPGS